MVIEAFEIDESVVDTFYLLIRIPGIFVLSGHVQLSAVRATLAVTLPSSVISDFGAYRQSENAGGMHCLLGVTPGTAPDFGHKKRPQVENAAALNPVGAQSVKNTPNPGR
ncbi:hypothetical protein BGP75_09425 [Motiliproteus sp. MSK22-1]|nr:hypothetical protein BGP75_09425 [Motiliproteus sp. MSK22-1]